MLGGVHSHTRTHARAFPESDRLLPLQEAYRMEQEISLVFPVVRKIILDCLFSQNAVCMPGGLCGRITM